MDNFNVKQFIINCKKNHLNESCSAGTNKENINENSKVDNLINNLREFGADEMEEVFDKLHQFYKDNANELTNMDGVGISQDLWNAYDKIRNRTGN